MVDKIIILNENNNFINIIDILKDLLDECIIKFTRDSIEINTVDKSMINLINIKLTNIYQESNIETPILINVKLEDLHKILCCHKNNSNIKIIFKEDKIHIKYVMDRNIETYKIKLLQLEDNETFNLNLEQNVSFNINSKYFTQICKNISKFDESIIISSFNNNIIFKAKNDMVNIENENNDNITNINISNNKSILIYLKYLLYFSKCDKFIDNVKINIDSEFNPLELLYESENCFIQFFTTAQNQE